MADAKIHVNDIGTELVILFVNEQGEAIDISTAHIKKIYIKKPGILNPLEKDAVFDTDGTDGLARHDAIAGDLDVAGTYKIEGYVVVGTKEWWTEPFSFSVYETLVSIAAGG